MKFTVDDIARCFDQGTFARGQDYARRGKVIDVTFVSDNYIEGEVAGSGGRIYSQRIVLKPSRAGIRVEGDCTCPMDYNCKHVVAVLLAGLDQVRSVPPDALDGRAERWLRQLGLLQPGMGMPPAAADRQLGAVLVPGPGGAPRLHLFQLRLRKNGSVGAAVIEDDLRYLLTPPGRLGEEDEALVRQVASLRAGAFPHEDSLSGAFGARMLASLCAAGRLSWADSPAALKRGALLPLRPGPVRRGQLGWHADGTAEETVSLGWRFDDGAAPAQVLSTTPMHYVDGELLGELAVSEPLAALASPALLALVRQAPSLRPEQRGEMARRLAAQRLEHLLPPPQALQTRRRDDVLPTVRLALDSLVTSGRGGWTWHDHAMLFFDYDGMEAEDDASELRRMDGDTVELIARKPEAEAAAMATLVGYGFTAPAPHTAHTVLEEFPGALVLPSEAAWVAFARHGVASLHAAGWRVEFGGNYRYELREAEEWVAELNEEGEGINAWFALELGVLVDGERHALLPLLLEMIRKAPRDFDTAALAARGDDDALLVDLPDGARLVLPWGRVKPLIATLGELYFSDRIGDALRLPVTDAARLAELEQAAQLRWMGGERLRELGRKLDSFQGIRQLAPPVGLQATLRPYQQAGLAWMQFLREYGFGGILADDMGLGKTIQTLAHILLEKEAGRLDAPALVVAPTSLMGNWQAEAARFAPGLQVLLLHGKERAAQFDRIGKADLVLTTYPLVARDEEALRRHRYHLLILDEAQYIKNSRSKAAQAARLLEARHRLCLTGTPVQNHLGELWSQFHFLMPGLLGEEKAFNAGFRKPIEQGGDSARRDLLARRVKPFMLRRTKDKVATELPPKTEIVLPVEFGVAQRDLYETVRLAMDRRVREEIDRKGFARSQIVILDALLKLRQVCCDPRLLKPATPATSAKLDALMELLATLLSEERKVLVFSQFTSMLALIGEALQARGVGFALLTGDTVDRAAPIAAFQHGPAQVFLISLKAGGVGLNLTAADTVIHFDPWWNPASENQATDRAWRIGQEQPVFVYKLIARGTLEEKIQDMQRRKGELASALLDAGGGLSPAIGPDDLQAIFAPLAA